MSYMQLLKTKDRKIWEKGLYNKLGCLVQGYKNMKGYNTFYVISRLKVPLNKRVTHAKLVCVIRPQKSEIYRT